MSCIRSQERNLIATPATVELLRFDSPRVNDARTLIYSEDLVCWDIGEPLGLLSCRPFDLDEIHGLRTPQPKM